SFNSGFSIRQPYTKDRGKIETALQKLSVSGGTELFSAVENALREVRKTPNKKKALVLITDAFTEGNIKSLQRSIRSSEVLIYTFAIRGVEQSAVYPTATISATFGSTDEAKAQQVLDTLGGESGGLSQKFET